VFPTVTVLHIVSEEGNSIGLPSSHRGCRAPCGEQLANAFGEDFARIREGIPRTIVGQAELVMAIWRGVPSVAIRRDTGPPLSCEFPAGVACDVRFWCSAKREGVESGERTAGRDAGVEETL
jgi:hypothetical protein